MAEVLGRLFGGALMERHRSLYVGHRGALARQGMFPSVMQPAGWRQGETGRFDSALREALMTLGVFWASFGPVLPASCAYPEMRTYRLPAKAVAKCRCVIGDGEFMRSIPKSDVSPIKEFGEVVTR